MARWLLCLIISPICSPASEADKVEFFESRIRPILAQECYECHSERHKVKAGLQLDSRPGWEAGGDSGPSIVPGDPENSLLFQVMTHEHEDMQMPKQGARLEDAVLADFKKWIEDGAIDPREEPSSAEEIASDTEWNAISARRAQWWSFQPVSRPEIPGVEGVDHPVDRFVRARLLEEGLSPSPKADPRSLHRRLSFTLIGLPPGLEESARFLEAWENDPDKATEKLVDELLADVRFAERWARHWMDWLRYADSHGSEGDPTIPYAWQYRDYLIRALHADIPYDQLVVEHLAGDLLQNPRIDPERQINESALGTGHLRMVFHGFAPTDALEERVRFTDDQINTVTKAFQGLTVSCARCHDHKFDAISQADYYALFGILTSPLPATVAVNAPGVLETNRKALADLKPRIRKGLADFWLGSVSSDPAFWRGKDKAKGSVFRLLRALRDAENVPAVWKEERERFEKSTEEAARVRSGETIRHRWDLSDAEEVAQWTREGEGLMEPKPAAAGDFMLGVDGDVVERILPAGVYSGLLSSKHRGFLASPPFHLDGKYDLYLNASGEGGSARYAVQHYPRRGLIYPVTNLEEGDWTWTRYGKIDYWNGDDIHLELATAGEAPVLVSEKKQSWFGIREAILVEKGAPAPERPEGEALAPLFDGRGGAPSNLDEATDRMARTLRRLLESWRVENESLSDAEALFLDELIQGGVLPNDLEGMPSSLQELVTSYRDLEGALKEPIRAPGLVERPGRDQPLFVRGNHKEPGEPVSRRFLEVIDDTPYETSGSGRLEFAQDLVRDDNPFTSRIIVNRIWNHLFGNGIVATVDNFGRMGQEPSHPGLLDYLALRFREEQDWSIKTLIRDLVLTETWQQASAPSQEALERDPENRLLSHFAMRRLDAEAIRDLMLAVSGQLDPANFGEPVEGTVPRRSVYLRVKRNSLDPLLTTFDFPVPASTVGRRGSTNVPAQSLTLLNDRFIIGQAGEWASRMRAELPDGENEDARIRYLFQAALNRPPSEREMTGARDFLYAVDQDHERHTERVSILDDKLTALLSERREMMEPAREELLSERRESLAEKGGDESVGVDFEPMASWDFEGDFSDSVGGLSGSSKGSARIEGGAVVVDGKGFVASEPLSRSLGEKTLEVVVQLSTFDQGGGGVMTVQDLRGQNFDSIVFAERKPQEWLVGSNNHRRTLDFGGEKEVEANARPVHLAITFEEDGTIRAYRDGKPYGDPIRKAPLHVFAPGDSQVVFGLRHGTSAAGNKPLEGKIFEARLYDRALEPHEVEALAAGDPLFVSEAEVIQSLTDEQRTKKEKLDREVSALESEKEALKELGSDVPLEQRRWQDLAHAIFNLKEFIYLR